jgi:hypothetical protein
VIDLEHFPPPQPAAPPAGHPVPLGSNAQPLLSLAQAEKEAQKSNVVEDKNPNPWFKQGKKGKVFQAEASRPVRASPITGKNSSTMLKGVAAPPPQSHFYVYRVSNEFGEDDIASYCREHDIRVIDCKEVCIGRYSTRSFRLIVARSSSALLMDENLWPTHIKCRQWNFYRKNE